MDVSIIIVTYNVRPFIHLCLDSIAASIGDVDYEVIVVDNHSHDSSVDFIKQRYPNIRVIQSPANIGFGKACNLGAKNASGKSLLFLNPDCIIQEDLIQSCNDYYYETNNIGALGGRMYDGSLRDLPESKRKFPTILNSLGRVLKIDKFFPNSSLDYYDRSDPNQTQKVDVLCGAFIFISATKFWEVGAFDDQYFMYGEDVDLCHQLSLLGYQNMYLPTAQLIHFKGESTLKKSKSYYFHFYNALKIYLRKNILSDSPALGSIVSFLIELFATAKYFIDRSFGRILIYSLFLMVTYSVILCWAQFYHHNMSYFSTQGKVVLSFGIPFFNLTGLSVMGYFHSKPERKQQKIIGGFFIGISALLIIYALLPDAFRYSRSVLLLSSLSSFGLLWLLHKVTNSSPNKAAILWTSTSTKLLERSSLLRLFDPSELYQTSNIPLRPKGKILSNFIIDRSSILVSEILSKHEELSAYRAIYFWDPQEDSFFNSTDGYTKGIIHNQYSHYNIFRDDILYQKRLLEIIMSSILLLMSPIIVICTMNVQFVKNVLKVLSGRKWLVGYNRPEQSMYSKGIKSSWIGNKHYYAGLSMTIEEMDDDYGLHYSIWKDVYCFISGFFGLIVALLHTDERED